jgi:putative iron-dependent peroxidase
MSQFQPGILAALPAHARYLEFALQEPASCRDALRTIAANVDGSSCVMGIGRDVFNSLGADTDKSKEFPNFNAARATPSTQASLWLWLRGDDRGELFNQARTLESALAPTFTRTRGVDGFKHDIGRDLTGYEDGTENPHGQAAIDAAFANDGGSCVAVQQWLHHFDRFDAMSPEKQDEMIGRHRESNEEFDAPASAHVKRTAQEDFEPEAFVLRRSMPWSGEHGAGLMFVAFGHSFDAFEAQMRRMLGLDDGIEDAIYQISEPVSGAYYWCPPQRDGQIDLRALGIS